MFIVVGELLCMLVALLIVRLHTGAWLAFALAPTSQAIFAGALGALVPLAANWWIWRDRGRRAPRVWTAFAGIIERLRPLLAVPLLAMGAWELVGLSVLAGVAEEMLFRGALQPLVGLVGASVIFGALHALTPGYFLLATLLGLLMGSLYELTGSLLAPVVMHTLYDLGALYLLRRIFATAP
ncbi:MAG: CPBP family intramembrane metalloprotease [Pseudomonadota bacterium]|nr:MAG: CPBP family intramembrane metalloprotease [Pseudomonadota bacterium]